MATAVSAGSRACVLSQPGVEPTSIGPFAAGSLPLDLRSTSGSISGNTITLSDGAFIGPARPDWNGDGSVTVQDIFDF